MHNITPRYRDLFLALLDPDNLRSDYAFDHLLYERKDAVPALVECFHLLFETSNRLQLQSRMISTDGLFGVTPQINIPSATVLGQEMATADVTFLLLNVVQLMGFTRDARCTESLIRCLLESRITVIRVEACKAIEDLNLVETEIVDALESCLEDVNILEVDGHFVELLAEGSISLHQVLRECIQAVKSLEPVEPIHLRLVDPQLD